MRKVIGIGETIWDIIFKNDQPLKAVPGGSTFNCMISLGRCEIPACFISEMGKDKIGNLIKKFMEENQLSSDYIDFFNTGNSPIALAFLDDHQNAEYVFYRNFPDERLVIDFPKVNENDIVIFGSYFALNPVLRERIKEFLTYAHKQNAIIYYDINFREAHAHERLMLMTSFIENFEFSSVIRCSDEDLANLYPGKSIEAIYKDHLAFYCKNLIVTRGRDDVMLISETVRKNYPVLPLKPLSTIGAGDNFNAGLIYGLMKQSIGFENLSSMTEKAWDEIISYAMQFAAEACLSMDNYVSKEFVERIR